MRTVVTGDRLRDVLAVTHRQSVGVCHPAATQAGIAGLLLLSMACTNPSLHAGTEPAALGGAWSSSILPSALLLLPLLPKSQTLS